MIVTLNHRGKTLQANLAAPLDISIPLRGGPQNPNAFGLGQPRFEPVITPVKDGGACNCEDIYLNPHGNGTHTECIGHIAPGPVTINQTLKQFFAIAQLISVEPVQRDNGDKIVLLESFKSNLEQGVEALVLRTLPNAEGKLSTNYSGSNPAYIEPELCRFLAQRNISHFLLDLPSVDREEDEGKLLAHHAFWLYPQQPRWEATISEMIFVPDSIADGLYLLNLQIAPFESDASPAKPVLYALF